MRRHAAALLAAGALVGPLLWLALSEWPESAAELEPTRVAGLFGRTAALAALSILIALVVGVPGGVALGVLPLGRAWVVVLALGLTMPLPVLTVAWQAVFGRWLALAQSAPGELPVWAPWQQGLVAAALVHGLAGAIAVMALVAVAVRAADPSLDEQAILDGGWRRQWRAVVWPRVLLSGVAGAAWVGVQVFTEITVTDATVVRTLAEEVYGRFVGGAGGVATGVLLSWPAVLVLTGFGLVLLSRLGRAGLFATPPAGGRARGVEHLPRGVIVALQTARLLSVGVAIGLPVAALAWRLGGGGAGGFRVDSIRPTLLNAVATGGELLLRSALESAISGAIAAGLALGFAWHAASPRARPLVVALAVGLAVTPGPVVGLAIRGAITLLLDIEEATVAKLGTAPLRFILYDAPSPVPAIWAAAVRAFPLAFALVAPVVWRTPARLVEQASLDGLSLRQFVRVLGWPRAAESATLAWGAATALAMGEVAATKLVDPPGHEPFILRLFAQMHYGAEPGVTALALLQLGLTAAVIGAWSFSGAGKSDERV